MSFHLSVADNMRNFKNWHTEEHPHTSWELCPYAPCDHMGKAFRACWK